MRKVALGDVLMRLVLPWMLHYLDTCSAMSDILSMERHVFTWRPCDGAGVSVSCTNPGRLMVLYSLTYNVTCTSEDDTCTLICRPSEMVDTKRQALRCNLNQSCSIPLYQCPHCLMLHARLLYACVPEDRLFPMCAELQGVRDVTWGILHSDMFPLKITTDSCRIVLSVLPSWRAVVRPLYMELPYPARIDVCSGEGDNFRCQLPGDATHVGDVTVHVTNSPAADSTRFVLEFNIYRDAEETTTGGILSTTPTGSQMPTVSSTGNDSVMGARNVSKAAMVVPMTAAAETTKTEVHTPKTGSSTVGPADRNSNLEKAAVSGSKDSSLTTQDYVILILGIFLGVVIISSVAVCIVVYRRSKDSALRRVVVVLVRNPTKRLSRLSRLSALFRTSGTNQHKNRYSNPPEELISNTNPCHITVRPVVVEESAQAVLTRLKELGAQPESWSSDSGRYEHPSDATTRVPLRRKRVLDPAEVVIEASADQHEQTTFGYSRTPKDKHTEPNTSTSKTLVQRVSSEEPIYELVAKPVLPPRRRSAKDVDMAPSALEEGDLGHVATTSQYEFTGEGLTIVDNDSYADVS